MVKTSQLRKVSGIAVLAAMAFILMNFAIPVIPAFPFLTLDLSDLPILLAGLMFGMRAGIETAFIKVLLHFIVTGASVINLIGDSTAFVASVAVLVPVVVLAHGGYDWRKAALGMGIGTVLLTVAMSGLNYVLIMPAYMAAFGLNIHMSIARYVLIGVVPFNIIKGAVLTAAFLLVAKALDAWLIRKTHVLKTK